MPHPHRRLVWLPVSLFLGAISAAACRQVATGPTAHEHFSAPLGTAASARVNLSMGAGELHVKGAAGALVDADFTYNVPTWKPVTNVGTNGDATEVDISQQAAHSSGDHTENRWDVAINDTRPMTLVAHVGAGEAHLTLGSLNLRRVELTVGAGEVDIDLRGTPSVSYVVSVHGGVGQATIHLPKTVAISASAAGGLGDIAVKGLEKRDGRWINPAVPSSPVTIELDVRGGVGQIELDAN